MIFIINRLDIIHRLTAQMRIFKSREIISQTRRKYQKLPEIQQRQQMECDMKIRRNHRMLVNMFSKVRFIHVLHTYIICHVKYTLYINMHITQRNQFVVTYSVLFHFALPSLGYLLFIFNII